jgi:hypothetical protein
MTVDVELVEENLWKTLVPADLIVEANDEFDPEFTSNPFPFPDCSTACTIESKSIQEYGGK